MNRPSIAAIVCLMLATVPSLRAQEESEEKYLLLESERDFRHALIASDTEVEVVSRHGESAREVMGVVSIINRREIELFGGNNLYEVLDRVATTYSLGTLIFSQNQISMRGDVNGNFSNRIAILLNGRPTWGSATEGVDYVLLLSLPLEVVERLEVHRGPGSVYHGSSAFVGAINIVTRRPWEDHEFTATVGGGSYGSYYASMAGGLANIGSKQNPARDERISFYGGAKIHREDGHPESLFNPLSTTTKSMDYNIYDNDHAVFAEFMFRGLTINALYASSRIASLSTALVNTRALNEMDGEKIYVNAGFYYELWSGWNLNLNAGYIKDSASLDYLQDDYTGELIAEGDVEIIDSEDWIFEGHLNGKVIDNLEFTLGAEVKRISGGNATYSYLNPYEDWRARSYMDVRYKPTGYLHFFGALQVQDFENIDTNYLTPKIGAMIDLLPSTSLKVMYGYATRSPSQLEQNLIYATRNTVDKPERVRTFETQISSRFEDVHFSATYFYSRYLDQIVAKTDDVDFLGWENDNTDMTTLGFELELQYATLENFYITANYGYVENRKETGQPGVFEIGFTHAPTYFVKGGIAWFEPEQFSIGLFSSYYSKPREVDVIGGYDDVNPWPEEYSWVTLNGTWWVTPSLKLSLYMTNLEDEEVNWPDTGNEIFRSVPGKEGRSFYLSGTFRFGDVY